MKLAWGIVYPDFSRIFFPYLKIRNKDRLIDRGLMLEERWRVQGHVTGNLADWRSGVAEGLRPAVIFNSTIPETGEPLVFATTDVPGDVPRSFYEQWPGADLRIATAARLSSTFPYATPASRPLTTLLSPELQRKLSQTSNYHAVDGGYYDDFGIASLVQWVDSGMMKLEEENKKLEEKDKNKRRLPNVFVIQIRPFPDEKDEPVRPVGWFYQSYAPIQALLHMRIAGQLNRGTEELQLLQSRWPNNITIGRPFVFHKSQPPPPLSWQMNPLQVGQIKKAWDEMSEARNSVKCFINGC